MKTIINTGHYSYWHKELWLLILFYFHHFILSDILDEQLNVWMSARAVLKQNPKKLPVHIMTQIAWAKIHKPTFHYLSFTIIQNIK